MVFDLIEFDVHVFNMTLSSGLGFRVEPKRITHTQTYTRYDRLNDAGLNGYIKIEVDI